MELVPGVRTLSVGIGEPWFMLVERGVTLMNVEVVGDACAIASNYLRKTGAIPDIIATDRRVLEIIVQLFYRGELIGFASPTRRLPGSNPQFV